MVRNPGAQTGFYKRRRNEKCCDHQPDDRTPKASRRLGNGQCPRDHRKSYCHECCRPHRHRTKNDAKYRRHENG